MQRFAYCLTACLFAASPVLAHPGHGVTEGDSAAHYLFEPLHAAPVVLVLMAGLAAGVWLKRRRNALAREYARKR